MSQLTENIKKYIAAFREKIGQSFNSQLPGIKERLLWAERRFPYLFTRRAISVALVILILLLAFISSNFVKPGNPLYFVKTYVSEKVGNLFAFTKYQQAERTRKLANERLSEAVKLLSQDDLSKNRSPLLVKLFSENAAKADQIITSVKASQNIVEAETMASRFEADLLGFEAVFLNLRQTRDGAPADLDALGISLDEKLTAIKKVRGELDESILSQNNSGFAGQIDETIAETQSIIAEAKKNAFSSQLALKKDEQAIFDNHLASAESLLSQSEDKKNKKLFGESLALASQAYREARTAQIFGAVLSGNSF